MLGVFFPLLLLLLLPIFDCCIRFRFFSSMTLSASATSHFFFAFSLSVGCSLQGDNRRIVRKSMYGIEVRSNRLIDHVYSSVQANKHIASHTHTHTIAHNYIITMVVCAGVFFCFFFSFVDLLFHSVQM